MSRQMARCPSCGADVHPHAHECPECGAALPRRSSLLPVMVGVAGVLVALVAGGAVWVILSPGGPSPSQQQAAAPEAPAAPPSAPSPAAPPAPETSSVQAPPADDAPLPLPQVAPGTVMAGADEPTRKEFARTTQQNFVQNGLDLKVNATGPDATVMNITFTFPAKMAVELISGGPFPKQCKVRGFTSITFTDTTGAAWTYDLATDKLTQK